MSDEVEAAAGDGGEEEKISEEGSRSGPGSESDADPLLNGMRSGVGRGGPGERGFESQAVRRRGAAYKLRMAAGWTGVLAVVAGLGIGGIWYLRTRNENRAEEPGKQPVAGAGVAEAGEAEAGVVEMAGGEVIDPGTGEDRKGDLPLEVAEKFIAAGSVEERLALVRDPERVGEALRAFFSEGAGALEKVAELTELGPERLEGLSLERFRARMEDGGERLLYVIRDEEEGAKVDFECYARLGSASWLELLTGEVSEAVVRVSLAQGTHYDHRFSDDTKWRNFTASTPDVNRPLDFYVPRNSELQEQLELISSGGAHRVTVGIRPLEGSHEECQFEVTENLGPGWVVGKPGGSGR